MSMGKRIKAERVALGLTQQGLAELIGCNRVSVTNWESARNSPDRDSFLALLKALNLTEQWLLSGMGSKHPGSSAAGSKERITDPEDLAFIDKFLSLSGDKKKAAHTVLDALAQSEIKKKNG